MPEQIYFSIAGTDDTVGVPCIPNTVSDSTLVQIGPQAEQVSFVVFVRTGHFISADSTEITVDSDFFTADNSAARPIAQKICQFRGRTFQILSVAEDGTKAYLKIALGSAN